MLFLAVFFACSFNPNSIQAVVQTITQAQTSDSTSTQTPDLDLTVFPPTAYLTIKPGSNLKHQLILEYKGRVSIYLTPQLVDFTTDGLTGRPVLQNPSKLKFLSLENRGWEINQPTRLKPEDKVQLTLKISPPVHARLQEYPLSLLFKAEPATEVIRDGSRAQAKGAVASNVILSVQPDFKNLGELIIDQIKLPKFVDSFQSLNFELVTENVGRNAVSAQGEIELIHGWSDKKLKHWFIYPDVILADTTRRLRGILNEPSQLEPGQKITFENFSYKPAFLLGPYQLEVKLSEASGNGSGSDGDLDKPGENKSTEDQSNQTNISSTQTDNSTRLYTQKVIALPFSVIALLLLGLILFFGYSRWEKSTGK